MQSSPFPAVAAMAHLPVQLQNISKVRALCVNPHRPSLLDPRLANAPWSSACTELSLTLGLSCSKKPYSSSLSSSSSLLVVAAVAGSPAAVDEAVEIKKPEQPWTNVWKDVEVGSKWREIQGENNWEGLLGDPLDRTLRAELIRYGEFAEMTYDAFDFDKHSIYCGSCKYSRRTLFRNVNKKDCGYEVKKYLYATSNIELPNFFQTSDRPEEYRWSGDSNWMGYIAVSTDEDEIKRLGRRDIMIAWRGTIMTTEWIDDLTDLQVRPNFEPDQEKVKVEKGFESLYTSSKPESKFNKLSVREQMVLEVKSLLKEYEGEEVSITVTGHSLGAALALLSAYDIAANLAAKVSSGNGSSTKLVPPVTVFSFSGPRVGNMAFKERVEGLGVKVLRVVNEHDKVPTVPGVFLNETGWWGALEARAGKGLRSLMDSMEWAYYHVGKELRLDLDVSPKLQRSRNLANQHNLEAHLHVLDGFHGTESPFKSVFQRNPALVNKSSGFLVVEAYIPPSWWQDRNKGLVLNEQGEWVLANRDQEHLPENHHP